jgi:hypothetical protein
MSAKRPAAAPPIQSQSRIVLAKCHGNVSGSTPPSLKIGNDVVFLLRRPLLLNVALT